MVMMFLDLLGLSVVDSIGCVIFLATMPEDMFLFSGQPSCHMHFRCSSGVEDMFLSSWQFGQYPSTSSCGWDRIVGRRGTYKAPATEASYMCPGKRSNASKLPGDIHHIGWFAIACRLILSMHVLAQM